MSKMPTLLVLMSSVSVALGVSGFDTKITRKPPLLRDGFVLRGVDGKLSGPDSKGAWHFEIAADVNDYRAVVEAGSKLELLPSSALEKMIADAKIRREMTYRLWNGRVTRYKGRNFIFVTFFLPLNPIKRPEPGVTAEPPQEQVEPIESLPVTKQEIEPITPDPNDVLSIPPDVLEKLRARRERMATSMQPVRDSNRVSVDDPNLAAEGQEQPVHYSQGADSVFVDRTAFLIDQADGRLVFSLDAFGRNIHQLSLPLLPCEVLELAEQKLSIELEPVRFNIAGILTRYEGQDYLLLQKATPTYSHENFGR
ncbi:MAG: hypothetical protein ACYTDV_02975 [Planctomycetota bacterium]|jgi:hypothetical protein